MKQKITFLMVTLSAILCSQQLQAQCSCNQADPFGYATTSCGLPEQTIIGSGNTCQTSGCSAATGTQYQLNLPNGATGYAYKANGGVVSYEEILKANNVTETRSNCTSSGQYGSVNGLKQIKLKVNWQTLGSSNCLLIWVYTGVGSMGPTTLSYFGVRTVTTSTPIAGTPTNITPSSPTTSPLCGWVTATTYVSNATSYIWSGDASGTYTGLTGPTVPENRNVNLCVKAVNSCSASGNFCKTLAVPDNPYCVYFRAGDPASKMAAGGLPAVLGRSLIITPNPASSFVQIQAGNVGLRTVILYSAYGVPVKQVSAANATQLRLDVSALPRGVYMLSALQSDGSVHKEKIILN